MAILDTTKLEVRFPGMIAVKEMDFDLQKGEVHAICGENGAGKSTFIKTIGGEYSHYFGTIQIDGEAVNLSSPGISKNYGIEIIQQELSLAREVSVAENVLAGRLPRKLKLFLGHHEMVHQTKFYLDKVGLDYINPLASVESLSQHEAQLVEIAKALSNNPKILIMDEPTSALSQKEVERLFKIIHELKSAGLGIIYITHHLSEVFEVADRVTVLRDGQKKGTYRSSELDSEKLIELMVGRSVNEFYSKSASVTHIENKQIFKAENLFRYGFFHDISFAVHEHEVVGICGLAGSGRSEIARSICALEPLDYGTLYLDGNRYKARSYKQSIKNRIVYFSENRKLEGLALSMSMGENLISARTIVQENTILNNNREDRTSISKYATELNVIPNIPQKQISKFSGGNQQKVLLAKWLSTNPRVLLLDEPTRGVDVGAKELIHKNILDYVRINHAGAVVISSDLIELIGLSDRIIILRSGHIINEFLSSEVNEEILLYHANKEPDSEG